MILTTCFMFLTLLISAAAGEGWEDRIGVLEAKVLEVPEGTEVPYPIHQFKSANPEVTAYKLSGQTSGKIAISSDGWLYLLEPLDWSFESSYSLEIEALADNETVDGPVSVTINIKDINNHPPNFEQAEYNGEVMERTPAGETFMRVSATDKDNPETPNARLSYSIVSQIPDRLKKPLFQINRVTGEISTTPEGEQFLTAREGALYSNKEDQESNLEHLKSKFNEYCTQPQDIPYELNPFFTCVERSETMRMNPLDDPDYVLIIRVQDLEGQSENAFSGNAKVNIVVKQNLWKSPGPITIPENLEAEYPRLITKVQSNHPGAHYFLNQKEKLPKFPFTINEEGQIFVMEPLDREEKDMYILVVSAEHEEGFDLDKPMEIPVMVEDINDNAPVCEVPKNVFEVQENEPLGNQVGVLRVYDLDQEGTANSLLSYQLISQEPPMPSATFTIEGISGKIQLATAHIKRKDNPEYQLMVKVSDQNGAGLSTECKVIIKVIDINNEVPVFEKNDYGVQSIAEDIPPGTTLLSVLATDADDPGTGSSKVEYHIKEGDPEGLFAIDAEGHVYIARPLDFETRSTYRLKIDATNPEPLVPGVEYGIESTTFVTINVTNVDEPPEFDTDIFEVNAPENITVGETILKMDAKDPEGAKIRYQLEGDDKKWLQINAETGEIKTIARLDHEQVAVYTVKVIAFEEASPEKKTEKDVTIRVLDVNDNFPTLKEKQGFVCVKESLMTILLSAEDHDSPPFGAPFTFTLTQPKKYPNWEIKAVDGISATLTLKRKPEEDKTYRLPINIKDNAGMGVSHMFEVRVCNCTELGHCYTQPEAHPWKYGMSSTIAILGGTLGFIGVVLAVVFHRSKKQDKKKGCETDAML
ncbi:hypothetical protein MATL_G00135230 [Megalops atlanticus]|uniref:Cadherin domain-containing protein n=1 Tax=Megalops atlanticus TaxID=7932 RepID=A0A9D3T7L2_MEGAT|nr:hypothetical protein MATL_G00135230 [Megalops atlanticus]